MARLAERSIIITCSLETTTIFYYLVFISAAFELSPFFLPADFIFLIYLLRFYRTSDRSRGIQYRTSVRRHQQRIFPIIFLENSITSSRAPPALAASLALRKISIMPFLIPNLKFRRSDLRIEREGWRDVEQELCGGHINRVLLFVTTLH